MSTDHDPQPTDQTAADEHPLEGGQTDAVDDAQEAGSEVGPDPGVPRNDSTR